MGSSAPSGAGPAARAPAPSPAAGGARRLAPATMALYGLPYLAYSAAGLPVALFVPAFYADDLGLPLATVGAVLFGTRLFDVVTDPLIGAASDRLRTRFGRRKPWVLAGAPLLLVALWQLFVPTGGEAVRGTVSSGYLLAWTFLLFLAFTVIDIPFKAWGAELSTDYAERSRVTAWREGLGFAGQIALLGILLAMRFRGETDAGPQLRAMALFLVASLPLLLALALWRVPERPPEGWRREPLGARRGLALVLRNPAFLRMVGAVVLFVSGAVVQGTLHRLVLTHVFHRADLFPVMIFLENAATLAAVPLWLRISDRVGKHRAVGLAALWLAAWSLLLPAFGEGEVWGLVAVVVLRGSSFAAILLLANSMAADVVDADTATSGRQRTGVYFAVWSMVNKLSIALGVLLGTALPAAFGFEPAAEGGREPDALFALLAVYGFVPALLMGLGAPFLWRFPITAERQAALRREIEARTGGPDAP